NLDLISLIATLQLKLEYRVLPPEQLRHLSDLARFVAAVGNLTPDPYAPYVGRSAFAHKGGIHVAAVAELPQSYQHIDPGLVGKRWGSRRTTATPTCCSGSSSSSTAATSSRPPKARSRCCCGAPLPDTSRRSRCATSRSSSQVTREVP